MISHSRKPDQFTCKDTDISNGSLKSHCNSCGSPLEDEDKSRIAAVMSKIYVHLRNTRFFSSDEQIEDINADTILSYFISISSNMQRKADTNFEAWEVEIENGES